jgi:hypothetical protein
VALACAGRYKGLYHEVVPEEDSYRSSGYWDDIAWANLWLYRSTNTASYLTQARAIWTSTLQWEYSYVFDWDNVTPGTTSGRPGLAAAHGFP